MTLAMPQLGPIVGHTADDRFRLWIKGKPDQRGIARIRKKTTLNNEGFRPPVMVHLHEYFDWTGIVDFEELEPSTDYEYQIGCVDMAAELPSWPDAGFASGEVKTFPDRAHTETSFILGSCRDPKDNENYSESDKTFGGVLSQSKANQLPSDFMMMMGDQIYIDHSNWRNELLGQPVKFTFENYATQYSAALSSTNFAALTARMPTFVTYDDHEIQNNWSKGAFNCTHKRKYRAFDKQTYANGLRAYQAYQANTTKALTRVLDLRSDFYERGNAQTRPLWYDFKHGASDFFVLDVRGERQVVDCKRCTSQEPPKMLGDDQLARLKEWLRQPTEGIKFIVSAVPFIPDTRWPKGSPKDKWGGYKEQRLEIIEFIKNVRNNNNESIERVVFLSGDVHVSFTAKLTHDQSAQGERRDFKIHNIISSAFYWNFLGLNDMDFNSGKLKNGITSPAEGSYQVSKLKWSNRGHNRVVTAHNFTRVSVIEGGRKVRVEVFTRSGNLIDELTFAP